jgi:hypothetical protein
MHVTNSYIQIYTRKIYLTCFILPIAIVSMQFDLTIYSEEEVFQIFPFLFYFASLVSVTTIGVFYAVSGMRLNFERANCKCMECSQNVLIKGNSPNNAGSEEIIDICQPCLVDQYVCTLEK